LTALDRAASRANTMTTDAKSSRSGANRSVS
jgi:hypothetical protein